MSRTPDDFGNDYTLEEFADAFLRDQEPKPLDEETIELAKQEIGETMFLCDRCEEPIPILAMSVDGRRALAKFAILINEEDGSEHPVCESCAQLLNLTPELQ